MTFDEALVTCLRVARHVVVFTGAGVSAESGISTFRDAQTGLWTQYDATELSSPEGFRADPALVWGWYEWRRMKVLQAQPNPAHYAIADLAHRVERLTLITQNVDDLHERAGSGNDILHLHGSLHLPRCFAGARPFEFSGGIPDEPEGAVAWHLRDVAIAMAEFVRAWSGSEKACRKSHGRRRGELQKTVTSCFR